MTQDLKQKVKVILGDRSFIAIRTLKDNFCKDIVLGFIKYANELGYHKCDECDFYVREDIYNHSTNMCNECNRKAVEMGEKLDEMEAYDE